MTQPPVEDMSVQEVIVEVWDTENQDRYDNDEGFTWKVMADQWWKVRITCAHGKFSGVSVGPVDLQTAFQSMLRQFREGHG